MMEEESHFRMLERMYHGAPCNRYYLPRLTIAKGSTRLVIPIREDFFHAAGAVHGSVYFKALDDAAFFAANSLVRDVFVLTASFEIRLLRPVQSGDLIATGRVTVDRGRAIAAESELSDGKGEKIATGKGMFLRSLIPLTEKIGYR